MGVVGFPAYGIMETLKARLWIFVISSNTQTSSTLKLFSDANFFHPAIILGAEKITGQLLPSVTSRRTTARVFFKYCSENSDGITWDVCFTK